MIVLYIAICIARLIPTFYPQAFKYSYVATIQFNQEFIIYIYKGESIQLSLYSVQIHCVK